MTRCQLPIWWLMVAVVITALYLAGVRVLAAEQTGGDVQAAVKTYALLGLGGLTVITVELLKGCYRRDGMVKFLGIVGDLLRKLRDGGRRDRGGRA